jgi:hypothetical protein
MNAKEHGDFEAGGEPQAGGYINLMPVIIMIVLIVSAILLINIFVNHKFPCDCNIGKNETAGDYHTTGLCGMGSYPYQYCAVQDCVAYNKLNNDTKCVV